MLHGHVKVNDHIACSYQITNEGQSYIDSDTFIYQVAVFGTDRAGHKYSFGFELHARSSAPGLVGMVLTEIDKRLNEGRSWIAAVDGVEVW